MKHLSKLKKAELLEVIESQAEMLQQMQERRISPPIMLTEKAEAIADAVVSRAQVGFRHLFGRLYWK